jgi:hypothetical protein
MVSPGQELEQDRGKGLLRRHGVGFSKKPTVYRVRCGVLRYFGGCGETIVNGIPVL